MEVTKLPRVFEYNGLKLKDPNPDLPLDGVKGVLALQYPEISNAEFKKQETSEAIVYTIKANYGQKG